MPQWLKHILIARPAFDGWSFYGVAHLVLLSAFGAGFFALVEPAHAQGLGFIFSFAMWWVINFAGFGALFWTEHSVRLRFGGLTYLPSWLVAVPIGGLAVTAVSLSFELFALDDWPETPGALGVLLEFLSDFLIILPQVFVFALVYHYVARPIQKTMDSPAADAAFTLADLPEGFVAFLARLKPELGADILSISAERHYLHIQTARGSDMVLGTLSEAEAACRHLHPIRVHRSHLVMASSVKALDGGQVELIDGRRLPVSRRRQSDVKSAVRQAMLHPGNQAAK